MIKIIAKFQRFERIRKLHTIISQQTIKPSSPTPPHLKTHNLSWIDHCGPNMHVPSIFFYQNYNTGDINILKKSLSQCLTQYYPFAGRLVTPTALHIDCNDEGVEFLEASIDSRIDDFILKKDQDETLDQLIPSVINQTSQHMAAIQLSHFTCGGVAVSLSISHKVGDAFTMTNFIQYWATLTRGGSPINSTFLTSFAVNNFRIPEFPLIIPKGKYARKSFVFPNSKLNDLKKKINTLGTRPLNPTRVESLTSLLYKCAVSANTTKSGFLKPSTLIQVVNLRGKPIAEVDIPISATGNFIVDMVVKIEDTSEIKLDEVITEIRKERTKLKGVKEIEEACNKMESTWWMAFMDNEIQMYQFSSICRFPLYEVDFGWGTPARVTFETGINDMNYFLFMDTACGDGIEAVVQLEEEEMIIFQKDKELHAYVEDI